MEGFLAYVFATTAGVRPLLSLAIFALAVHFHYLQVAPALAWVAVPAGLWTFGALAVCEVLADKVPFLDHAVHVAQIVVKPAAAVVLVGGTMHSASRETVIALCVVGALNALGVHIGIASLRGVSTAGTGGIANPVISIGEDLASIGSIVLGFFAPILAATLALLFTLVIVTFGWWALRRMRRLRAVPR